MAARLTLLLIGSTLAACGQGGADVPDARQWDATVPPPTCDDYLAEWNALVASAKECSDPGDCIIVDGNPQCDVGTFWGDCGYAVNAGTFDAERAAQLELASNGQSCAYSGVVDCGYSLQAGCVEGQCQVVDERCCLCIPGPDLAGTVAVIHEVVTNDLSALGIAELGGLSARVRYEDRNTGGPGPVFGNASLGLGDCNVYVYTDPADEFDTVDEGTVSISGLPDCAFDVALDRYACFWRAPGTPVTAASADFDPNTSLTTITIPGETFVTDDVTGMHVDVVGFTHPANGGALPIVRVVSDEQIEVFSAAAALCIADATCTENDLDETMTAAGTYAVEAGAGSVPRGYEWFDGVEPIAVTKAEGDNVPAFTLSIVPSGDTLALAGDSAQPHAMPATADADVVVRCDECGNSGGLIIGWMLEGVTTDADVTGLAPWAMPTPSTTWARFKCRASLGATSIALPAAAWAAVLGTSPTRIQTRASRVTADLSTDPSGVTSVVAGHGFVGYTDL